MEIDVKIHVPSASKVNQSKKQEASLQSRIAFGFPCPSFGLIRARYGCDAPVLPPETGIHGVWLGTESCAFRPSSLEMLLLSFSEASFEKTWIQPRVQKRHNWSAAAEGARGAGVQLHTATVGRMPFPEWAPDSLQFGKNQLGMFMWLLTIARVYRVSCIPGRYSFSKSAEKPGEGTSVG